MRSSMPIISPISNIDLFVCGRAWTPCHKICAHLRKKELAIASIWWYHCNVSIMVFAEWVPTHSFLRDFLTMYVKVRRT